MKRVLAISSKGGHWVQLLRLRPAWDLQKVYYATSDVAVKRMVSEDTLARGQVFGGFFAFPEANRWQKLRLVWQLATLFWILIRVRPNTIVTTGAAPGYFALRLGRLLGAKTIWVDSIANSGELSLSGKRVGRYCDLWLTQWEELSTSQGPFYRGSVL